MNLPSISVEDGMRNAARFLKEAQTRCVKMKGATKSVLDLVWRLTEAGVPVMSHLGLTPSPNTSSGDEECKEEPTNRRRGSSRARDGSRRRGRSRWSRSGSCGASARGDAITVDPYYRDGGRARLRRSGPRLPRLPRIAPWKVGKFVKEFASVGEEISRAALQFKTEVGAGTYPSPDESYD